MKGRIKSNGRSEEERGKGKEACNIFFFVFVRSTCTFFPLIHAPFMNFFVHRIINEDCWEGILRRNQPFNSFCI